MVRTEKPSNQRPISSVSKEPSGAQKRKLSAAKEAETKLLQEQAAKHFRVVPQPQPELCSNEVRGQLTLTVYILESFLLIQSRYK